MFIAINEVSDTIVSGFDVLSSPSTSGGEDLYRCLLCGKDVTFRDGEKRFDFFTHANEEDSCFKRPGNSHIHQTACEMAIKEFCSKLGCDRESVDVEKRITNDYTWVTADVRIQQPDPIVVEVYYRSRHAAILRKLNTILKGGYSCYIICIANGEYNPEHTPADFNESLQTIGPIEVGTYTPRLNDLSVGTRITPELVDLDTYSRRNGNYDYILQG